MSPPNSQSPPRTRLRCLDQGPTIRKRDITKKSTGGRPLRKLLSTRGRSSLIQRPTRHDLYRMKRREAILSAAKEALEAEQVEEGQTSDKENTAVADTIGIPIEDELEAVSLIDQEAANSSYRDDDNSSPATKNTIPNDEMH